MLTPDAFQSGSRPGRPTGLKPKPSLAQEVCTHRTTALPNDMAINGIVIADPFIQSPTDNTPVGETAVLPPTTRRVSEQTAEHVNARIRRETEARVARIAADGPDAIARRLKELDREWDIERTLEANAATVTAVGSALALLVDRRFALVPLVVGSFLLQHAVQGWCPPLPAFRRMGVRTQTEIEQERYALKALRGDFEQVRDEAAHAPARANQALQAVNG